MRGLNKWTALGFSIAMEVFRLQNHSNVTREQSKIEIRVALAGPPVHNAPGHARLYRTRR